MSNKFSSKKKLLTFRELGGLGRFANQMFQYAATRGIAANRNFDCAFPPPNDNITLYKCFKNTLKYSRELPIYDRVFPVGFHFDEPLFHNCAGDRDILHFFQTEKYFKHIRNELKEDFSFDKFISDSCKTYINEIFGGKELISLHVRRTDYLNDQTLYALPLDYYEEALKLLDPTLPVLVISDDYKWCKKQKIFSHERFKVINSRKPFVDLCMMTLCDYHIIANSSFSWWGAWLAESKQVISPQRWFRHEHNTWDTKDVYCSGWIKI